MQIPLEARGLGFPGARDIRLWAVYVGAGNLGICKSSVCSRLLSPLSSPSPASLLLSPCFLATMRWAAFSHHNHLVLMCLPCLEPQSNKTIQQCSYTSETTTNPLSLVVPSRQHSLFLEGCWVFLEFWPGPVFVLSITAIDSSCLLHSLPSSLVAGILPLFFMGTFLLRTSVRASYTLISSGFGLVSLEVLFSGISVFWIYLFGILSCWNFPDDCFGTNKQRGDALGTRDVEIDET